MPKQFSADADFNSFSALNLGGVGLLRDITFPVSPRLYNNNYFVGPHGNDSNNGTSRTTPFLTLAHAVSVSSGRVDISAGHDGSLYQSGDLIQVLNGDYNLGSSQLILKDGVDVVGQSRDGVIIHGTFPLVSGAIVKAPSSATLANATLQADSSPATPQVPLGACHNDAVFTNFVGRNLRIIGNSDCLKVEPAGTYSAKIYNSLFQTRFDCWNDNVQVANIDFIECQFFMLGYAANNVLRGAVVQGAGTMRMFRCLLNAYSDDSQQIGSVIGVYCNGGKALLYDTDIVVSDHAAGSDFATSLSQSGSGFIGVSNCTYDSTITVGTITPILPAGFTQPASANDLALTDSTGGSTANQTLNDVTATPSQSIINANFAKTAKLVNQLRADLVALGIIKGSA